MKKKYLKIILKQTAKFITYLLWGKNINSFRHLDTITLIKTGICQKIFFINRHVSWPVHFTSQILCPEKIVRGNRTPGFAMNCFIDGRNGIIFGENVWVGPRVTIISQDHKNYNFNLYKKAPSIQIGNNSLLCANSIILPGVTLSEHTIVAAGAVVTKSFNEKNIILAGNPAKIVKKLDKKYVRICAE